MTQAAAVTVAEAAVTVAEGAAAGRGRSIRSPSRAGRLEYAGMAQPFYEAFSQAVSPAPGAWPPGP
ncbi:hypothetical protein GCM10010309_39670 [Streptomyces violaceochromogenes]|nr:hypothetical protein GCM10010309_39670 [Streptomyces violaceochromogenes]